MPVTANHATYFFRQEPLWRFLAAELIPLLLGECGARRPRELTFWSAATSDGAEAYTLAMVLHEALPEAEGWRAHIVATDSAVSALQAARTAEYDDVALRGVSAARRDAYFEFDASRERYRVCAALRARVTLKQHDLCEPFGHPAFDVALLRNVLSHFDLPAQERVLTNVLDALRPGGFLIVGDIDPLRHGSPLRAVCTLEPVRACVYRKPAPISRAAER